MHAHTYTHSSYLLSKFQFVTMLWVLRKFPCSNKMQITRGTLELSGIWFNPPREEMAARVSGKPCLWRKFIIKFGGQKCHLLNDNHWQSHMTSMARNNCTRAVFTTSSFNFGLPTYFVSHKCYGRTIYAVLYKKFLWKKRRAELFDCGLANDMSKVTCLLVCIVLTP